MKRESIVAPAAVSKQRSSRGWIVFSAVAVVALCGLARWCWGPSHADAQSPRPVAGAANALPPIVNRQGAPAPQAPSAAPAATKPSKTPEVVATVNGEPISQTELAQECVRRFGKEVLEAMVNKQLIQFACQQRGVNITPQDVDQEITSMASKFGLPRDRWLEMLQQERGISLDQYRRDVIWPTLALRKLSAEQIQVTPQELQQAYESEYGPRVKVRLISVNSAKQAAEVRAKAAAQPETFGNLAKEYSQDPNSAAARGLIPPIRRHVGDPLVEQAAFALKQGEVSAVIHTANQYLVLYCEQHLPATPPKGAKRDLEEQLASSVRDRKLRTAATDLFQRLQKEAQVENVFNDPAKQKQYPGVAALVNGRPITIRELSEECVARNGRETLDGEINRKLLAQALKARGQNVNEADVDAEISRAARSFGFLNKDGTPNVEGWLKRITEEQNIAVDLYVRDAVWPTVALKKLVANSVKVTEEDLQKGYEANYGERVEALVCVLSSQRQAQQVWEQARGNPTDEFFGTLAAQYSIEPVSKSNGGRVPPIRKFGGQPLIEKEAFNLNKGELSGIVAVGDKFIIMRCLGRTQPVSVDMNEVRSQLLEDLQEKQTRLAMANQFDALKEGAQIDNFITGESQAGKRAGVSKTAPPTGSAIPTTAPRAGVAPASATGPLPARQALPTPVVPRR